MVAEFFGDLVRDAVTNPSTRVLIGKLLDDSGVLRQSYSSSPEATAFQEGRRSVGLPLFGQLMEVDETLPLTCMREFGEWINREGKDG